MSKIFIIGLPRTGTTSISVALLDYGFKVAHTAYTKRAFELADVISDAPCFSDYKELDQIFPNSKFVYLDRAMEKWIPSMQMLVKKMLPELKPRIGYLNPVLKRSFNSTFATLTTSDPLSATHLEDCYDKHQQEVYAYFYGRSDLLTIDISDKGSLKDVLAFLGVDTVNVCEFPHLNRGNRVDNWQELKHPNKINSMAAGVDHRKFFDYEQSLNKVKA
jgi:hypothetical protein